MTHELYRNSAVHTDGFRDADPLLLEAHLHDARVVDVREAHEFGGDLGHIRGAQLVPLATLPSAARDWDLDRTVVVVCRSGGRSGAAARQLVRMGFQRVVNLRGGMMAWNTAGRPVDRAAPSDAQRAG